MRVGILIVVLGLGGLGCDPPPCDGPDPGNDTRETARPLPVGMTDGFVCRAQPDVFEIEWGAEEDCAEQVIDMRVDDWRGIDLQIIDESGGLVRSVGRTDWNLALSATTVDPCAATPPRWVEVRLRWEGVDEPPETEFTLLNLML